MVPDLIWAPDFFGSQEIWSPDFHGGTKFIQDQVSRGPNFSGIKFLEDQISRGSIFLGTKNVGAQMRLRAISVIYSLLSL